jgi:hypothetical protein
VNKEVNFAPHPSGLLMLSTTSVTDQHWSVRDGQQGAGEMQGSLPK